MALGNAYAWLQAGLCPAVLAGATEAPLTAFTLAQLGSLRVFADADLSAGGFPCRPFSDPPQSYGGMLLAEGAAAFALVAATEPPPGALGRILGFGTATEAIPHAAGITAQGHNLAYAMRRALAHAGLQSPPGLVLAHAPGTPQGDAAELHALHQVFGPHLPPVFSHKGIVGHTLGAAGALGVALGLQCLGGHLRSLHWPYPAVLPPAQGPFATVLVNAVGFGGVAASLLLGQA
jgi:3-oxoacyl-(acyl-carrier-protein) synthase